MNRTKTVYQENRKWSLHKLLFSIHCTGLFISVLSISNVPFKDGRELSPIWVSYFNVLPEKVNCIQIQISGLQTKQQTSNPPPNTKVCTTHKSLFHAFHSKVSHADAAHHEYVWRSGDKFPSFHTLPTRLGWEGLFSFSSWPLHQRKQPRYPLARWLCGLHRRSEHCRPPVSYRFPVSGPVASHFND